MAHIGEKFRFCFACQIRQFFCLFQFLIYFDRMGNVLSKNNDASNTSVREMPRSDFPIIMLRFIHSNNLKNLIFIFVRFSLQSFSVDFSSIFGNVGIYFEKVFTLHFDISVLVKLVHPPLAHGNIIQISVKHGYRCRNVIYERTQHGFFFL